MKDTKFLYTDGKDVVVTQSALQTKDIEYRLKGITDFGMSIIKPKRLPGLLIIIAGISLILNAFNIFIINQALQSVSIELTQAAKVLLGGFLVLAGLGYMFIVKGRYAVRIETAEGDKDVVISKSKEYIDQILNAIRRAKLAGINFL
jgi:hypothetical protein